MPVREKFLRYEWLWMRVIFAFLCVYHSSHHRFIPGSGFKKTYGLTVDSQTFPVGLAQFFDLTWAASPFFAERAPYIFYAALALYLWGKFPAVSTGILLFFFTIYGTLENSQGAIHHTVQIIGYALFGQLLYFIFVRKKSAPTGDQLPGPAQASVQAVAAAYVVSALSKLIRSGFGWVNEIPNVSLQLEKNRLAEYYNTLVEPPEVASSFIANLLNGFPLLGQAFFGTGLILELTAFVAIFGRRWALAWGLGLWGLHVGITEMMHLGFFYNKAILFVFFINPPFWIYLGITKLIERRKRLT